MDIKKKVKKAENELKKGRVKEKICVVCGKTAQYCMRGLPENKYCKECAKDYFKLLGYLDKL
ncbi:hypothetical protein CMO90_01420 [Candidatus Woesearchaeota archaeon]|jgi:hypothetical protein|nr:hypothetical protein [Candidatus Woesearchaeota archaeon]|tara:strand:- start:2232 stop:2417 length:186 start_codon:yes stop_codon:yes gene_type:complete